MATATATGPYAILGYSWCGCTNGNESRPRAREWDEVCVIDPPLSNYTKPHHLPRQALDEREDN